MKWEEMGYIFWFQNITKYVMKYDIKKVDLAVKRKQSVLLKLALRRVHTARHSLHQSSNKNI